MKSEILPIESATINPVSPDCLLIRKSYAGILSSERHVSLNQVLDEEGVIRHSRTQKQLLASGSLFSERHSVSHKQLHNIQVVAFERVVQERLAVGVDVVERSSISEEESHALHILLHH